MICEGNQQLPARSGLAITVVTRVWLFYYPKGWSLHVPAQKVDVCYTYLSRAEHERLNFGDYLSFTQIHGLAEAFEANDDYTLFLAKRIPEPVS